jgi:hypothetical protein
MDTGTDRLGTDLASAEFLHGVEQEFWESVSREGDRVYILMHAPDGRKFLARMDCDHYWDEPIGCLFVDAATRQVIPAAWPDGNSTFEQWIKFRANPHFICWRQDRYGIERHQEWKNLREWQKKQNQIVAYLEFLQQMLYRPMNGYSRKPMPVAS